MKPELFFKKLWPEALKSQQETGVPALVIMAQAALESSWGDSAPGHMYFGMKDSDGVNGNEQLLRTTEYDKTSTKKYPQILSVKWDSVRKMYHYIVKDYFRKYNTPADSFTHHAQILSSKKRYRIAMAHKNEPYLFAAEIHKAGYATDPDYTKKLHTLMRRFESMI